MNCEFSPAELGLLEEAVKTELSDKKIVLASTRSQEPIFLEYLYTLIDAYTTLLQKLQSLQEEG